MNESKKTAAKTGETDMSETEPHRTIVPGDAGCWLDGQFGWHNTYRVVEIAQSLGFRLYADDEAVLQHYRQDRRTDLVLPSGIDTLNGLGVADYMSTLAHESTNYLNTLAPKGYVFQWDAGELSLIAGDYAEQVNYSE